MYVRDGERGRAMPDCGGGLFWGRCCSQECVRLVCDTAAVATKSGAMHVVTIRRRHGEREYVSHLVRRSIREGERVRKETIANISGLPVEAIEAVRRVLAGETLLT